MALSVIGAGFGRTGTLSLKVALEKLGVGRSYHMEEVMKHHRHPERWTAAADQVPNWDPFFVGYGATLDWPTTYFWRELAAHYPAAKVILTVRSSESWLRSMQDTLFGYMRNPPHAAGDTPAAAHIAMVRKLIVERTFGGNIDDEAHVVSVYERHNEEVRRTIPAERLLVFEPRQGWEPLCRFLDVPVPDGEFPRVNTTDDFLSRRGPRPAR
jgi:hypothetical protein